MNLTEIINLGTIKSWSNFERIQFARGIFVFSFVKTTPGILLFSWSVSLEYLGLNDAILRLTEIEDFNPRLFKINFGGAFIILFGKKNFFGYIG